jgi:predicted transcriptional regulator
MEKLPLGLAVSDKEVSQILFPTLDGKLDYAGFKATDKESLKWCRDLFTYYWENQSTKMMPSSFRDLLDSAK